MISTSTLKNQISKRYWISTDYATVYVVTDHNGVIRNIAPIYYWFNLAHIKSLLQWLRMKHGGYRIARLTAAPTIE